MSSIAQIEANRRNAKKSTGPRTQTGKATSSLNAFKTGIDAQSLTVPGEDPEALEALTAAYLGRFHPSTPEQSTLVDILIHSEWILRRVRAAEAALWAKGMSRFDGTEDDLAFAIEGKSDTFDRIQTRLNALQRNFRSALHELERLQALPPAPEPQPDIPEPLPMPPPMPQIGFVPQALTSPTTQSLSSTTSGKGPAMSRSFSNKSS